MRGFFFVPFVFGCPNESVIDKQENVAPTILIGSATVRGGGQAGIGACDNVCGRDPDGQLPVIDTRAI